MAYDVLRNFICFFTNWRLLHGARNWGLL